MFVRTGVSYERLYYVIKSLIEHNTFEVYPGFTNDLKTNEIVYLIKNWYSQDKKLRELVSAEQIANSVNNYSVENDPINEIIRNGGFVL